MSGSVAAVRQGVRLLSLARLAIGALLIVAAGIAAWHVYWLIESWRVIAPFPYGLDYGEGIVWQQMTNMFAGKGYAPLGTYPAIVYHYPPVYHLIVGAAVAVFGSDPLATGRVVSALCTLVSALVAGGLTMQAIPSAHDHRTRTLAGAATAMAFLVSGSVAEWGAVMRVDMLACALSLGGLSLAIAAMRRRGLIHLASLCFVAASYSKQVAVGAPLAAIVGLALAERRLAIICLLETAAMGLGLLGLLEAITGGGFLRHVLLYNVNRVDWSLLRQLAYPIKAHLVLVALAVIGAFDLIRGKDAERRAARTVLLGFLAIKIAMLAMIVKSGANSNYLIETIALVTVFAGIALAPVIDFVRERRATVDIPRALISSLLLVQVAMLPIRHSTPADAESAIRPRAKIVEIIRAARRPVISDDMTFLLRAGRPVQWEPAIVAELGHLGRYDEAGFIRMVRAHRFSFFVTEGDKGVWIFDGRYDAPVLAAIETAYPHKYGIGGYVLRFPN